jgi:hypothetical protein
MRNKKSASSKNARRRAERSHQKLAEEFLARLDGTWQRHGREILDRVMAERPEFYFQALIRLTEVLHRRLASLRILIAPLSCGRIAAIAAAHGEQGQG